MALTTVILLPLIGGLLLLFVPRQREGLIKALGFAVSAATLVLALVLYVKFDTAASGMQYASRLLWIPGLNVSFSIGIDGLSLMLVLLTAFLVPVAMLSSWESISSRTGQARVKEYTFMLLLLETGMIGVFCALDLFLFYIFWEAMLVPMYFLIGIWGGERKVYAAFKFFLYTMAGSMLMLVAIVVLGVEASLAPGGKFTTDLSVLYTVGPGIPFHIQSWMFLAFALSFAIKIPLFPFHTWLPDAHVEAPTAGCVRLPAVLPSALSTGGGRVHACRRDSRRHRDRLWGAALGGSDGHEETRRLLFGQPSGFRRAGNLFLHGGGGPGEHSPDGEPRALDRSALPHRRDDLRKAAYTAHLRVRRPREGDAALRHRVHDRDAFLDRASGPERVCGRVPHPARIVPLRLPFPLVYDRRRHRRHPGGGLSPHHVPAGHVRRRYKSGEPRPPRPLETRNRAPPSGPRVDRLDRSLSRPVSGKDCRLFEADHLDGATARPQHGGRRPAGRVGAGAQMKLRLRRSSLPAVAALLFGAPAPACAENGAASVSPFMLIPFLLLLLLIAVMPFLRRIWWEKRYPLVSAGLGCVTILYYLVVLRNPDRMAATGMDYFSFIVLIGSLFVAAGGIHLRIRGDSTPLSNTLLLSAGAQEGVRKG